MFVSPMVVVKSDREAFSGILNCLCPVATANEFLFIDKLFSFYKLKIKIKIYWNIAIIQKIKLVKYSSLIIFVIFKYRKTNIRTLKK